MTTDQTPKTKAEKALELALDIRKFEIELYWKRATYFWAFLAVALAGYLTVLGSKDICGKEKSDALLGLSCLGIVFSLAWYFVNRGSKFWQENWEKHVDMLEDGINGPLYKTIMKKEKISWLKPWHPYPFSVSKINQILSVFYCAAVHPSDCLYPSPLSPQDAAAGLAGDTDPRPDAVDLAATLLEGQHRIEGRPRTRIYVQA